MPSAWSKLTLPEDRVTFRVPNFLDATPLIIEDLYNQTQELPIGRPFALDMGAVRFIRPYGAIALVMTVRQLAARSGHRVQILNLRPDVHQYLHRMDFFDVVRPWTVSPPTPEEEWARSQQTQNLLELTRIGDHDDIKNVVLRADRIFTRWLGSSDLKRLLSILSELCSNIHQHSGDEHGCVMIQRYERSTEGVVEVSLAVGDLGCGIRGSLSARYPKIGKEPLNYIYAALQGRTARLTGRGGLGLRHVEGIVQGYKGWFWLRSETAAILTYGPNDRREERGLALLPGTQAAVLLKAPSPF